MLKLGEKIISDIYLGDKKIAKVFLGAKLVYQANKPIFLDYVIFDSASWIDTGLYGSNNTKIEATYQPTAFENGFYGSYSSGKNFTAYISKNGAWRFGNGVVAHIHTSSIMCDSIQNKDGATVNGKTLAYSAQSDFVTASTLTIGKINGSTFTNFKGNIYGFKVYESEELIQDLRPCIDPKGIVCMYDMVTKKYFYNQGTGTLKASGRFVKSILFDGASYIDTGLKHQTCVVECDIRFEETGTRQLMGFGTGSGQYWGAGATGIFDYMAGTNALDRTLVVIDFNAEKINYTVYADGKSRTSANGSYLSSHTYRIGAGPTGVSSNSYWCTCEIWSNKFTNAEGELIQDLRPYVDENGTACFKDVVTNTLFYNKGTGTLGYTE